MDSVIKGVLEEELERNLQKQKVFLSELLKYPKGSLVVTRIHNDQYLYRKYRSGNKIVSNYIGPIISESAQKAIKDRKQYVKLKKDINDLKIEERNLRRAIKIYG